MRVKVKVRTQTYVDLPGGLAFKADSPEVFESRAIEFIKKTLREKYPEGGFFSIPGVSLSERFKLFYSDFSRLLNSPFREF